MTRRTNQEGWLATMAQGRQVLQYQKLTSGAFSSQASVVVLCKAWIAALESDWHRQQWRLEALAHKQHEKAAKRTCAERRKGVASLTALPATAAGGTSCRSPPGPLDGPPAAAKRTLPHMHSSLQLQ